MSKYKKTPIPDDLRQAVFKRDGYTCRYCGSKQGPFHCDHVYPERHGGVAILGNLVTACRPCNTKKGDRIGLWPPPDDELKKLRNAKRSIIMRELAIGRANAEAKRQADRIGTMIAVQDVSHKTRENVRLGAMVYLTAVATLSMPLAAYGIEHSIPVLVVCIVAVWVLLLCMGFLKVYTNAVDRTIAREIKKIPQ